MIDPSSTTSVDDEHSSPTFGIVHIPLREPGHGFGKLQSSHG